MSSEFRQPPEGAKTNGLATTNGHPKKQLILNAFDMATPGHLSPGLWRHPRNRTQEYMKLSFWTDLAKLLDEAGFHTLFLADVLGCYDVYKGPANHGPALGSRAQFPINDPLYLVPAMAAVTKNLCFGITASTTYEPPYSLARRFSTVDHLSNGRVAWNIVTSYLDSAVRNFGLNERVPHDMRYEIAEEYMTVLYKLWEGSWRDDAVVVDTQSGLYAVADRVRQINHKGKHFNVPGPHICEPSPQEHHSFSKQVPQKLDANSVLSTRKLFSLAPRCLRSFVRPSMPSERSPNRKDGTLTT
jgi:FMN-dependent oxidoreductase (nitrilotriacetate monooxygenase family)